MEHKFSVSHFVFQSSLLLSVPLFYELCSKSLIRKHTPEDNGDIESFHNSLKTDYIWVNALETFEDAEKLMEHAFIDYNTVRPHSSIDYLPPDEFERRLLEEDGFMDKFLEERKRKEEKRMKNRIERNRRLMENVSLEDGISVQN